MGGKTLEKGEALNLIRDKPHKLAAIGYLVSHPSLILALRNTPSKWYFKRAIRMTIGSNSDSSMEDPLPDEYLEHLRYNGWNNLSPVGRMLYSLTKMCKPEIVVETGVAWGESSSAILCAMNENTKGHLYSIDLPPCESCSYRPNDLNDFARLVSRDGAKYPAYWEDRKSVGPLVPENLRSRWTLISGDSKVELPLLLRRLDQVSFFLHDSLHTYEHMTFEFKTAWPAVEQNGLFLSHDAWWNNAFRDFSKEIGRKSVLYYGLGMIRK